tara:strand:+ start:1677 stop:2942 length:1266 start_codon:yes stop_codon:yes gene_type:complete
MKVSEIRKLISESGQKEITDSLEVNINYPFANFQITLKGLDIIYQFFYKEHSFFDKIESLPTKLENSKNHFDLCMGQIQNFTRELARTKHFDRHKWKNIESYCTRRDYNHVVLFNKDSEVTSFLLDLASQFRGAVEGAYDFLTNQQLKYNNTNRNYFTGWHRAYEFYTQDLEAVKRRTNERKTLGRIRSEYLENLEQNDKNVSEHISEKKDLYKQKENALSRLFRLRKFQYDSWKNQNHEKFNAFLKDSDKAFKDLEKLYTEKLKLEAPATYWNQRAKKLRREGNTWLGWLIGFTTIAIIALGIVLYFISDGTLKELFESTGSAIRWSIVFITFVSFLAYGVRTFAKLMFSAYHLTRDAEEREQLAYVYLALKKEKNIDDTERHLIMQSLFSRADSGLLKDDSTPSMPGGSVLEKVIGGSK